MGGASPYVMIKWVENTIVTARARFSSAAGDHPSDCRLKMKFKSSIGMLIFLAVTGCGDYSMPPQKIVADGRTYYACKDYVLIQRSTLNGSSDYSVTLTTAAGKEVKLTNIKRLKAEALPSRISAPMPSPLPNPESDRDDDGELFKNGWTYDWPGGKSATLRDGKWFHVMVANPVCDTKR